MTTSRYPSGCSTVSQVCGEAAAWSSASAWNVNFNNGNVNNNHRNNNGFALAVRRAGEWQGNEDNGVPLQALYNAWRRARRQKVPSHNQLRFDVHWGPNLLRLQDAIERGTWQPKPSVRFIATRPKAREIHAPDFADRVVHHWLVPKLEAIWDPRFIHDSYANRVGRGSHAAVRRLQQFVREVDSGQGDGWYLQMDIHNYFNSIHRATLWARLKPVLQDARLPPLALTATHALLRRDALASGFRDRASTDELALVPRHKQLANAMPGCGLPIGNLSSQFFANVYLDALDQYVKHTLRAKRYLRYVDDFVIVHRDRDQLEAWQAEIESFLGAELKLSLKPGTKLHKLQDGIDFLGYIVRPTHMLVRPRVVAHARQALAEWEGRHVDGKTIRATRADRDRLKSVLASYDGHFQHANTHRLRSKIDRRFPWIRKVQS